MNKLFKKCSVLLVFIVGIMLFGMTNVHAEGTYTMHIDANGGIEGKDFKDTIVLEEDKNYPVSGMNEDFLKAPEGKAFSTIEIINADGEIEGYADSVLLWGADFCDNETLKFYWGDAVSDINIDLEVPKAGDSTDTPIDEYGYYEFESQTNKPNMTIDTGYESSVLSLYWVDKDSYIEEAGYYEKPYIGTFEGSNKYYVFVELHNLSSKEFGFAKADAMNIKVNGQPAKVSNVNSYGSMISMTIEVEIESTYEVKEGANQEVNNTEYATFRILADYSLFKDGGKVFVDGNEVSSDNYISEEGSTIITLLASYVNTLSAGEHTLKVEFNNSKTATTTFTVSKSETVDKTSAIAIPNTNLDKPVAGDNIVLYVFMFLSSVIVLFGTTIYKKKTN